MSSNLAPARPTPAAGVPGRALGPLGRLGVWTASHARIVFALWALTVIALGLFAPRVEQALAGAGWEASGSESVVARQIVQREFAGMTSSALQVVVHSRTTALINPSDPANQTDQRSPGGSAVIAEVTRLLEADPRVSAVVAPQAGVSISRDGRTVVIQAGAATGDTNEMVRSNASSAPTAPSPP
jgi:RND superfamily putative drug exporter